jgi:uncharacterized protein involved in exopolysaccharide biosynthesis
MSERLNDRSDSVDLMTRERRFAHSGYNVEAEVDLLDLWQALLKHKWMIIKSVLGAAALATVITLVMPNSYRSEVLLSPVRVDDNNSGLGGLGGLASLAGISLGYGGGTEESLAVIQSREFLWKFVQEKKLMPILFERSWLDELLRADPPGQWDVYRLFVEDGKLSVTNDKDAGTVTLAVEWSDRVQAAEWTNALVTRLNQYLAQQAIARSQRNLQYLNEELMRTPIEEMRKVLFDLIAKEQKNIMLASTQKEFAFKVLDPAIEPDKKSKPKRGLIVIIATIAAGILASLLALIKEGIAKRREEKLEQGELRHTE